MSIWIEKDGKQVMAPYSYKKTLVAAQNCGFDNTIMWLEGVDFKMKSRVNHFGTVGGAINTNTGIELTRENLKEILEALPEKGVLKVCGCNSLYLTKQDLKYSNHTKTVQDEFDIDNNMEQITDNSFRLKKN